MPQKKRFHYVLTCIGPKQAASFYETLLSLRKQKITLGAPRILAQKKMYAVAIPLSAKTALRPRTLMNVVSPLGQQWGVDLFIQGAKAYALEKRLVVLDLESTLIQAEVLDELAKELGMGEKVAKITQRAMNGEIPFQNALRERVSLLKGVPARWLDLLYKRIRFTPGAVQLMATLRKKGCKTAIITGGFDYFAERYKKRLKADYAFSNRLEIKNNTVTGHVVGEIIDGPKKAFFMEAIAKTEGIGLNRVVAVGDGANDLPMILKAGLGIAFNAKPAVCKVAPYRITQKSLVGILHLLGISEEEIVEGP